VPVTQDLLFLLLLGPTLGIFAALIQALWHDDDGET
jgi:hypothetical protein